MGYALFFKENTLHKLYGSKPSDFQLSSLRCRGVARNAARSLCVLNETLYYLSPDGVMAWDGSIPAKVSAALDAGRLANVKQAVGGALDGRYYLHVSRGKRGASAGRMIPSGASGTRRMSAPLRWPAPAGSSISGMARALWGR